MSGIPNKLKDSCDVLAAPTSFAKRPHDLEGYGRREEMVDVMVEMVLISRSGKRTC